MSDRLRYNLMLVIGLMIILSINIGIYYIFTKNKSYDLTDFLGKWELVSAVECSTCVNLHEEIIIRSEEAFRVEDNQLKIAKRSLMQDYSIPTDLFICFNLDPNKIIEEPCNDTKETTTYNLIYEKIK